MQTACRYGKNNLTNASDEYDFEVKMKKRSNATRCYLSDKSHITASRKAIIYGGYCKKHVSCGLYQNIICNFA